MEGIVLAGGYSSRYHKNKMMESFKDQTILEKTINTMLSVCDHVYVITGHYDYDLKIDHVSFVHNENYDCGMYSSVRKGMQLVNSQTVFIIPGDMPLVDKNVYQKMLLEEGDVVLPSFEMHSGHPIKISSNVIKLIIDRPDTNLRDVLKLFEKKYVAVDSNAILIDIDTALDYKNMIRRLTCE